MDSVTCTGGIAYAERSSADPEVAVRESEGRTSPRQMRAFLVMPMSGLWEHPLVDVWEHEGRLFEVVMASDVINDGMGLELTDLSGTPGSGPVMEAFWHDDGTGFDFMTHQAVNLPFTLVERFVAEARRRLPPSS